MNQLKEKRPTAADFKRGLPIALSMSIDDALMKLAAGKTESARVILEDALIYADSVHEGVAEHVGLENVRSGKGVGFDRLNQGGGHERT